MLPLAAANVIPCLLLVTLPQRRLLQVVGPEVLVYDLGEVFFWTGSSSAFDRSFVLISRGSK